MKREEAIKILQPIGEQYCEIANITLAPRMDEIAEAIDMAIDALKAQLYKEGATSDLISRQAAIDGKIVIQRTNGVEIYYDEAVTVGYLKNLPPAQPEPKEGHWIWAAGELMCSECRTIYSDLYPDYDNSVACPHCGARMKGERQK